MLSSDWLALDVQFLVKSLVMLCRPGAHIRDFHAHNPTSQRGNNKNISTDPLHSLFVLTEMLSTQLISVRRRHKDSFTMGQELEMSKFQVCVHWGE